MSGQALVVGHPPGLAVSTRAAWEKSRRAVCHSEVCAATCVEIAVCGPPRTRPLLSRGPHVKRYGATIFALFGTAWMYILTAAVLVLPVMDERATA